MSPCVCVRLMATLSVTVEIPELLKGLQNQCELFIHGSNPQIYCHLICGYDGALMALMPSNRCPCSATQVRLHLVTPLSPGARWPTAHFIFSSGGNYCMKTFIIVSWRV